MTMVFRRSLTLVLPYTFTLLFLNSTYLYRQIRDYIETAGKAPSHAAKKHTFKTSIRYLVVNWGVLPEGNKITGMAGAYPSLPVSATVNPRRSPTLTVRTVLVWDNLTQGI